MLVRRPAVFYSKAADKRLLLVVNALIRGRDRGSRIAESEDVMLGSASFLKPEESYRFQIPTAHPERI
jgi:hypothetical protein